MTASRFGDEFLVRTLEHRIDSARAFGVHEISQLLRRGFAIKWPDARGDGLGVGDELLLGRRRGSRLSMLARHHVAADPEDVFHPQIAQGQAHGTGWMGGMLVRFSEERARAAGITPLQYLLLLQICGIDAPGGVLLALNRRFAVPGRRELQR